MKLTFISNYLTRHQLFLSQEFKRILGEGYTFVATLPPSNIEIEREKCDMNEKYPFVLQAYKNSTNRKKANELAKYSDVVVIGSASDDFIKSRLRREKLTFKYCERLYKGDMSVKKWVRAYIGTYLHYTQFKKHNFYILASSAYTTADLNKFYSFKDKTFKWGYFPEVKKYQDIDKLIKQKTPNSLLWCGRIIDLKHTEAAVLTAERLKKAGYAFTLNIIGTGNMESYIKQLITNKKLNDCVHMLGSMSPDKVRENMEKSEIFIFTSDFNEGWGAVLNEAMNSGCACVASHAVGAAPYLIDSGKNGLLYKNGNGDDLFNKVKYLMDNTQIRRAMGAEAYKTMNVLWNPAYAAERFISLAEGLLKGDLPYFDEGPCSRADILKNNWM